MYNPESILENETYKLLRDFEIQTDNLISARPPGLVIVNKKENQPVNQRVKLKNSEKRDKYLGLVRKLKKKKDRTWR